MKKRLLPTIPSMAFACVAIILSGCSFGLQPLPDSVQEQLNDAVEQGMDGVIVCVNRPG